MLHVLGSTLFQYKYDSEGIFSLAKKASHPLNCAFFGKVFCRAFLQKSSPPEARILPINQNLKSFLQLFTRSDAAPYRKFQSAPQKKTVAPFAVGLMIAFFSRIFTLIFRFSLVFWDILPQKIDTFGTSKHYVYSYAFTFCTHHTGKLHIFREK